MVSELLIIVYDFREEGTKSRFNEAQNITLLLLDLDMYKSLFETTLQAQTSSFYQEKAR